MLPTLDRTSLRQGVLAVSVLEDLDIDIRDDGVLLPGRRTLGVRWQQLAGICADRSPLSDGGRRRMTILLRLIRQLADLGDDAPGYLMSRAVAIALPPGHVDHFGTSWARRRLAGGALDLGLGIRDVFEDTGSNLATGRSLPLPAAVLRGVGVSAEALWAPAIDRSERMAALAVATVVDGGTTLRPIGGCDVLTLLVGANLRRAIADSDGTGMRAFAAPNRTRGWFDLARIDTEYVNLAWQLTDEAEQGLPQPVLVTRSAVTLPRLAGGVSRHAVEGH